MSKKKQQEVQAPQKASRIELYKRSTYRKRNEKPKDALNTTFRLIKYLKDESFLVFVVILLIGIQTALSLGTSVFYRNVIDGIEDRIMEGFLSTILILGFFYVSSAIVNFFDGYIMNGVSQRTLKRLRKDIFAKMQVLAISFFDRNRDGDLMSRITNDVDNISTTLTQSVTQFIGSIITLVSTLALMLYMNWLLSIVTFITVPLIYFAARIVSAFSRKRHRQLRYELGALNGYISEQIDGAKVIQSFVQEGQIIDEFTNESNRVTKTTVIANTLSSLMGPTMELLGNLRYIIIITAGAVFMTFPETYTLEVGKNAFEIIIPVVTVGTITAFVDLANKFSQPLNQLANLYTDIVNALSGAERIFDILDDQTIIQNAPDAIELTDVQGHVELRDVKFAYIEDRYVLNGISIEAKPGQKIALVGHTGAGKTTIINMITRFYDVNSGEILIDGTNIKDVTKESLLEHVGIVLQDTNLFSTTIRENIRYGKLDATDEEIIAACKLANCHNFIASLPDGYDTMLTHNGSNLSQGQRQLLSIARTLLKNPDILILDEATSSVDTMTELKITEAIETLTSGKTSFIIAHRLSTIRNCDLIVVMKDGNIMEQGNHHELLQQQGIYYKLLNAKPNDSVLDDYELVL